MMKGIRWNVDARNQLNIWDDPWVISNPNFRIFSPRPVNCNDFLVRDLMLPNSTAQAMQKLRRNFSPSEILAIKNIHLGAGLEEDRLIWHFDRKGLYIVKYQYWASIAQQSPFSATSSSNQEFNAWNSIWNLNAQVKI